MNNATSTLNSVLQPVMSEMAKQAEEYLPHQSFWYRRPARNFPPESIQSPSEYDGLDRLSLVCTQTSLSASAQRKLADEWCEVLPALRNVKFLWFHSRVSPKLFDAACKMSGLEGLYIKWSGIESLENLPDLTQLKYLYLGSSTGVKSIAPLSRMTQLQWLEMENIKLISDFSPLAALTGLTGLGVTGSMWSKQKIDTLGPISTLRSLKWLALDRASDESLAPLAHLAKLEWLGLPNRYPASEFAWLSSRLPETECRRFSPYEDLARLGIRCKKCKVEAVVMLTGKGKPNLCPKCDSKKLEAHVAEFARLRDAAG